MYKWIYASNSAILAKTPQIRNLKVIQKRKKQTFWYREYKRYREYKKLYIEIVVKLHPKDDSSSSSRSSKPSQYSSR